MEKVFISTDTINLMQFLKLANVVMSGGEVKHLVDHGMILVNGEVEDRYRRKLVDGDVVVIDEQIELVVINEDSES
jgi:ribosome-associated protein